MRLNNYQDFETAYYNVLEDLKFHGMKTSPRGRSSRELLGYNFTIEDPTQRLIGHPDRDLNIFYAIGNLLWVLQQSDKLDVIKYYNERGYNFSDDGEILRGAYGKRLFDKDGVNQIHQCIKELKLDPESRRAVVHIHMAQHDWAGSLDTPCTNDIQFFIREGKLNMICHMRSQSAAMVMPYDIFLMTMLQEIIACELEVELGYYQHFCNSLHYYGNEEEIVYKLMDFKVLTPQMQKMPKETSFEMLKKLFHFESELRKSALNCKLSNFTHKLHGLPDIGIEDLKAVDKLRELKFPRYWEQIGMILIAKALHYTDDSCYDDFVEDYIDDEWHGFLILKGDK